MARVGIDLDGVCYDFAASVREYLHRQGLRAAKDCPEATRWEFYEDWGLSVHEFLDICHRGAEAGVIFLCGDPYPNVKQAFDVIRGAGHTIHVVTDRSFGAYGASEAATRTWLDLHGLKADSLTFAADKTVVRLDVMVDDKPANYDALEAAGVEAYMLTRPWNQHHPAQRRVLDLLHFAELIA